MFYGQRSYTDTTWSDAHALRSKVINGYHVVECTCSTVKGHTRIPRGRMHMLYGQRSRVDVNRSVAHFGHRPLMNALWSEARAMYQHRPRTDPSWYGTHVFKDRDNPLCLKRGVFWPRKKCFHS